MKATKKRISTIAVVSGLFILSVLSIVPEGVLGDTEYLDPDGDGATTDWTPSGCTVHADCIDDAIRQPDTGVDANYISTGTKDTEDKHTYEDPTVAGTVTDVYVWIYGYCGDVNDKIGVLPSGVSGWSPSEVEVVPGVSPVWMSASWTGLSIDMANFNSLEVSLYSRVQGSSGGLWRVEAVYVELTYTPATQPASLTVTLRKSDNTQERIDVGYWGNYTLTPGNTNENSTNFVRAQCDDCDGSDDSFWVNWSGTTWISAKTGDTITIDSNYRLYFYETTSGTACPDDGGWSWSDSGVDADGDYQITFTNSGTTYVWVRFRIESVPSPLSGGTDYLQDFTVELDR